MEIEKYLLKIPSDFSLERFVNIYVEECFNAAKSIPQVHKFYNEVYRNVAKACGLNLETVEYLHYYIDLELFKNKCFLEVIDMKNFQPNFIILGRREEELSSYDVASNTLNNWGDYLNARVNYLKVL